MDADSLAAVCAVLDIYIDEAAWAVELEVFSDEHLRDELLSVRGELVELIAAVDRRLVEVGHMRTPTNVTD